MTDVFDELLKAGAVKYYKRIPASGGKTKWRYFYTKTAYDKHVSKHKAGADTNTEKALKAAEVGIKRALLHYKISGGKLFEFRHNIRAVGRDADSFHLLSAAGKRKLAVPLAKLLGSKSPIAGSYDARQIVADAIERLGVKRPDIGKEPKYEYSDSPHLMSRDVRSAASAGDIQAGFHLKAGDTTAEGKVIRATEKEKGINRVVYDSGLIREYMDPSKGRYGAIGHVAPPKLVVPADVAAKAPKLRTLPQAEGEPVTVQRGKPKRGYSIPKQPSSVKIVDSGLYNKRSRFGVAGGPDEIVLSEQGSLHAAKAATDLKEKPIAALEALHVLGGEVQIEQEVGSRLLSHPFAEEHGGPQALGVLSYQGFVELSPFTGKRERSYRLTGKGKAAISRIEGERASLVARIEAEGRKPKTSNQQTFAFSRVGDEFDRLLKACEVRA